MFHPGRLACVFLSFHASTTEEFAEHLMQVLKKGWVEYWRMHTCKLQQIVMIQGEPKNTNLPFWPLFQLRWKEKRILSKFAILQKWVIYLMLLDTISKFTRILMVFLFQVFQQVLFPKRTSPTGPTCLAAQSGEAGRSAIEIGRNAWCELVQKKYTWDAVVVVVCLKEMFCLHHWKSNVSHTLFRSIYKDICIYRFMFILICIFLIFKFINVHVGIHISCLTWWRLISSINSMVRAIGMVCSF